MEAVPKLPMLYCDLKISPLSPDFGTPFKRFISKHYQEDGESYDREIRELETLRNNACRAPRDFTGCSLLKRYYSQIYSLHNRFSVYEPNCGVQCVWADIYSGQTSIGDLDFELSCVLYNIGALHAELGALDLRNSADSMKVACTHFQCAAWAFEHLRDDPRLYKSRDMSHDILSFFVQIMLAQAQECILEKSMLDNRKSSIVAKVASQVVEYYSSALLMLLQAAINTSGTHTILDIVGSKLYKEWKKFIEFKVAYYNAICSLFMGNLSEEQQKMGDRVSWYQMAEEKLNDAIKLAKNVERSEINEAVTFVTDVISVKLGNARKENDFVYHEKVPSPDKLTEVKGASLVKGIPFDVCDPEVSGNDIFARLVSIEAHETASIYSAKKDEIMRNVRIAIEERNQELVAFMASLHIDRDTLRTKDDPIPDELIEICAKMSVNPESVDETQSVLNELEDVSNEVNKAITETKKMIEEEEEKERIHQEKFGKRPPSMIIVELSKELLKHEETNKKAMISNTSLRENFDKHVDDVRLLISSSAHDITSLLPSTTVNVPFNEENLQEMEKLLLKIDEMKSQRAMLENQLKDMMNGDDIMKQVLSHPKEEMDIVFQNEIKKYDKHISLLQQNMSAQENILKALTRTNAKYADTRKALIENHRIRKARIASLLHTYEIFEELTQNSKKGLEFYKKFQNIVARLVARVRGVSRVQDDERTQFANVKMKKTRKYPTEANASPITLGARLSQIAASNASVASQLSNQSFVNPPDNTNTYNAPAPVCTNATISSNNTPIVEGNQSYQTYQQYNTPINSLPQNTYQYPQIEQQNGYNPQTWSVNSISKANAIPSVVPSTIVTPNPQISNYNNQSYVNPSNNTNLYHNPPTFGYSNIAVSTNNVSLPTVDCSQSYQTYPQQNLSMNSVPQNNYQYPSQMEQSNGYNSQQWTMNAVNNTNNTTQTVMSSQNMVSNSMFTPISNYNNQSYNYNNPPDNTNSYYNTSLGYSNASIPINNPINNVSIPTIDYNQSYQTYEQQYNPNQSLSSVAYQYPSQIEQQNCYNSQTWPVNALSNVNAQTIVPSPILTPNPTPILNSNAASNEVSKQNNLPDLLSKMSINKPLASNDLLHEFDPLFPIEK